MVGLNKTDYGVHDFFPRLRWLVSAVKINIQKWAFIGAIQWKFSWNSGNLCIIVCFLLLQRLDFTKFNPLWESSFFSNLLEKIYRKIIFWSFSQKKKFIAWRKQTVSARNFVRSKSQLYLSIVWIIWLDQVRVSRVNYVSQTNNNPQQHIISHFREKNR